jgi:hypothetical protein
MKKVIYTLLIVFSSTLLFSACTEEEIAPTTLESNVGADFGDDVKK